MLKAAIRRMTPGIELGIEIVDNEKAIEQYLNTASLLLVNRVLEGDFDSDSGVDLIAEASARGEHAAMMLISDFPDAQESAIAAGALPGFGKSQLYNAASAAKLRQALGL